MTRILVTLYILISTTLILCAQSGTITGIVSDSIRKEPVGYASVRLLSRIDSSFVRGLSADDKGRFKLQKINIGKYILEISFVGYKTFAKNIAVTAANPDLHLGKLLLTENTNLLDEAVVTTKVPDIQVKGDTIEYNANAYISDENALLQDLIKNIPGIELDANGNLKANGEPIKKILVDGKEFFDGDIQLALKNLPANMIKKLQLFKEQSDQSKLTGFKDGKEEQVLNLKVKEEFRQSLFGEAKVGYGSDNKYSNKVTMNYMRGDNQLSMIGNLANLNVDSDFSGFFSPHAGIDKNKNVGFNFNREKTKKFKIGGNIRYADNENVFESKDETQNLLPDGNRYSIQNSSSTGSRRDFNVGVNLAWKPDSLTTIYFRTMGGYGRNRTNRESESVSYVSEKDTTKTWSDYNTEGDNHSLSGVLSVGRKLGKKGRTLSFNLSGNFRKDNSDGTNKSTTIYSSNIPNKIIDQLINTDNQNTNWGISVSYVEPITANNSIMLSYSYRKNNYDRIMDRYRNDGSGNYTIVDTDYTRRNKGENTGQIISLNFQSILKKFEYSIGFNIDPSHSVSKITMRDSIINTLPQKVVDFSPSFRLSYKPKENISYEFNYHGTTNYPTSRQLLPDTTILSATSKVYGNPNLKPSFNNTLNVYFRKSDYKTGRFLMLMGGFGSNMDQIVDYTLIDSIGNTETTYRNVSGNMNANVSILYNTPLRNKKFSIDANTSIYYYRNIGFSNREKSITNNLNMTQYLTFSFRSDKFENRLMGNYTYSIIRNNLPNQKDMNTSNLTISNSSTIKFPLDFVVQNEISYKYNSGYSAGFKKSELLWNASISKLFLQKKKGTFKAQFFDILKDRNNVTRTVIGSYISDMRTNLVSRYFLLSFSYRFNIAKGKKQDDEMDIDMY